MLYLYDSRYVSKDLVKVRRGEMGDEPMPRYRGISRSICARLDIVVVRDYRGVVPETIEGATSCRGTEYGIALIWVT